MKTITEESLADAQSHSSRPLFADGNNSSPRPYRDGGGEDPARFAPNAVQSPEREGRSFRRDGPTLREGVRRRHGNLDEDAEFVRHRANTQPREEDPRRAL